MGEIIFFKIKKLQWEKHLNKPKISMNTTHYIIRKLILINKINYKVSIGHKIENHSTIFFSKLNSI